MCFKISTVLGAQEWGAVRQASPGGKAGATRSINLVETAGTRPVTCRRQGGQRKMCPRPHGDYHQWATMTSDHIVHHLQGNPGRGQGQRPGGDGLEGTWSLPGGMGRGGYPRSPGQWGMEEPPAELERRALGQAGWRSHAFTLGERLRSRPRAHHPWGRPNPGPGILGPYCEQACAQGSHACHLMLSVLG